MTIEHTLQPSVLAAGEGERFDFLDNLATIKVVPNGSGTMSVVEFLAPHGFGPPEHTHTDEDELFVILEGTLRFLTGGGEQTAAEGGIAFLPRAVPHTFQVISDSARFVNVTTRDGGAPRFDEMVRALGSATERLTLPEPSYVDPTQVAEVCAHFGIDIVGPPPAPITQ